jgi:hypothetical protein
METQLERGRITSVAFPKVLMAGNATLTFESTQSDKHMTFNVKKHKERELYFVRLRVKGEGDGAWEFMGTIFPNETFGRSAKSKLPKDHLAFKVFEYIYLSRNTPINLQTMRIYHEGRCLACGRALTDPDSVRIGLGPQCRGERK